MEKKIKVHSFIDVITNSSTESYVRSNAKSVEFMHDFINEIFKQSGSEKKSEDLFEFIIIPAESAMEIASWHFADKLQENDSNLSYSEAEKLAMKKFKSGEVDPKNYLDERDHYDNTLLMKSKSNDQFTMDISEKFSSLFDVGEREN
jgi:hypothetical protein